MTDWNRYREIDALRESGHPTEALEGFKSLRAGATDAADVSSILLGESLSYRDLGRFDKAAEVAEEAIRLLPQESPSRPYAEFSLACVHEGESKFDLAAQEFRTLLKRHADLLSTSEYIQFRRGVQLRLIANLIVLGQGIEPLSIADGLKTENISAEERAELSFREAQAHGLLGRHDQSLKLYLLILSRLLQNWGSKDRVLPAFPCSRAPEQRRGLRVEQKSTLARVRSSSRWWPGHRHEHHNVTLPCPNRHAAGSGISSRIGTGKHLIGPGSPARSAAPPPGIGN
jgi:tetratricopeptide (TPR) repeat protein